MKTRKRLCYVATLLALFCLSSCGQNDSDDTLLPAGKYPMTFTPLVNELAATRATTDNTWDGGEIVTLQVEGDMKRYTITGSGSSSTLTAKDAFYWTSSKEPVSVCGWYCGNGYLTFLLKSWEVQNKQSDGANYKGSDLLYASAQDISFSDPDKSITFYHQTARVVINIVNAEVATDAEQIAAVTFGVKNNIACKGNFIAPDGTKGETFGTWTDHSSFSTITPKEITPPNSKYLKSYTALLIPQNMQNKKFIAITLNDGKTYYFTPEKEDDANFEAGKEYTYDVTVKFGELEAVLVSESSEWGSNGEPIKVKSTAPGFSAYDLKIGDYYYSDGTTSDGGYRKYADGTSELLDIKPILTSEGGIERQVIGIVFWAGDATKKDQTLRRDYPNCTHGLVVALNNASNAIPWQEESSSVQDWLDINRPGAYLSVESPREGPVLNNIQGYNNTKAIEEFNDGNGNAGNLVQAVLKVVDYRNKVSAPAVSSDWYLPSAKELTLLYGGEVVDNIFNNLDIGEANKELITKKLVSLDNVTTEILYNTHWSSSHNRTVAYTINNGGVVDELPKSYDVVRVRCVLAF